MPNTLGIIAFNDASVYVRGLSAYRPIAALNYVGRYRLVDIPISNMANSGLQHLQVYTNGDPKVLFEHIGSARHYNINNKHGHIDIIPVFTNGVSPQFVSDMAMYHRNIDDIKESNCEYVVIAPVNYIYKANYADLLKTHIESGADISILSAPVSGTKDELNNYLKAHYLEMASRKEVKAIKDYIGGLDSFDLSLDTYFMSKELFIELVEKAVEFSDLVWMKDMINYRLEKGDLKVNAIPYMNVFFPILDYKSYFSSNMKMLEERNMAFFNDPDWPIYTRTNDSAPTIYKEGGGSSNSLISNGCEIAGQVTKSILGRNVKVGKGAVLYNCLILPDAVIEDGAMLTGVIMDTHSTVQAGAEISNAYDGDPYYVGRSQSILEAN